MSGLGGLPPCPTCGECHLRDEIVGNLDLCPGCGHHYRGQARSRLGQMLDADSFAEWDDDLRPRDDLAFVDLISYPERLADASRKSGLDEAVVTGSGTIEGIHVGVAVVDFGVIGGRMGGGAGEKVAGAAERAASWGVPLTGAPATGRGAVQGGPKSLG